MGGAPALVCAFHYPLYLSSFTPTPFLCGLLGLYCFLLFPHGLGHWLGKSPCPSSPLIFCSCNFSSCYAYRFAGCHSCHVNPLGFIPLVRDFTIRSNTNGLSLRLNAIKDLCPLILHQLVLGWIGKAHGLISGIRAKVISSSCWSHILSEGL